MTTTWRASLAAAALLTAVLLLLATVGVSGPPVPPGLPVAVGLGLAALVVYFARAAVVQRRRYQAELLAAAAREAVVRDRLLIAADLHDVVSHGLGAITLRARAGQVGDDPDGEAARTALADVVGLSTAATADLRGVLAVLRDPSLPAPTRPALGLADVPALVERARAGGAQVALDLCSADGLPDGVQLAAAHVVREGLENAARHAGATAVRVEVVRDGGRLRVSVVDAGPAAGSGGRAPGAGHGLELLAARVAAQGGRLEAGPDGAGFAVRAVLPAGDGCLA